MLSDHEYQILTLYRLGMLRLLDTPPINEHRWRSANGDEKIDMLMSRGWRRDTAREFIFADSEFEVWKIASQQALHQGDGYYQKLLNWFLWDGEVSKILARDRAPKTPQKPAPAPAPKPAPAATAKREWKEKKLQELQAAIDEYVASRFARLAEEKIVKEALQERRTAAYQAGIASVRAAGLTGERAAIHLCNESKKRR